MRIALFSPYLPFPALSGGRIRMSRFIKHLQKEHEIHLYAPAASKELDNPETKESLSSLASWSVNAPSPFKFVPGLNVASRVRTSITTRARRAFFYAHQKQAFDAIWVEHVHAAKIASELKLPWLLDEHNIESEYLRSKWMAKSKLNYLKRREILQLKIFEEQQWGSASEVVCVTESDAKRVAKVRGHNPTLIPNGVDIEGLNFKVPSLREGKDILFVGLMNHPPNEQSARFLALEVMPRVWASSPEARLVLCGANPSVMVKKLAEPRIVVTGTVPSVFPYLDQAKVYAFPLFHGAGSSLKLLEAMACGIPVVASQVATRGFGLADKVHFYHAELAEDFADHIVRCLSVNNDEIAHQAYAVAQRYDWRILEAEFETRILRLQQPR